jgi:putative addiction module component (TIGR02574 family)
MERPLAPDPEEKSSASTGGAGRYNVFMSPETEKLLAAALRLPPEARAALAGMLIDSLDQPVDPEAEVEWDEEIARRLREIDDGIVRPVPWSEARRTILGER